MNRRYVIYLLLLLTTLWGVGASALAQQEPGNIDGTAQADVRSERSGKLWSVQTSSSRNPAGAIDAVLRLRTSGHADAGVLMLFDNSNTLWYIVELAATENRNSARQIAEAFKQTTGKSCSVKSIDAGLHAARLVSEEGLRNSSLILSPAQPSGTGQPEDARTNALPSAPADTTPDARAETPIMQADNPSAMHQENQTETQTDARSNGQPDGKTDNPLTVATEEQARPPLEADVPATAPENIPDEPSTPFSADTKQAELIIARSLFRQGDITGATSMYQALLVKYGPEEEIRDGYVEILIDGARWAEAEAELADWREARPDSLPALRQTARLYLSMAEETGDYEASYPWLEAILAKAPEDIGAQTDYAYARLNAGDWSEALQRFGELYDANPDDENAAEAIQTILRERGPQLRTDYRSEVQAGDVSINTLLLEYSQQINSQWRALATHERSRLDRRSDEDGTQSIAREVQQHKVALEYEPGREWKFTSGAGFYEGAGEGTSMKGAVERRFNLGKTLRVAGEFNTPWLSSLDATNREGTTDTYTLSYEQPLSDNWTMTTEIGAERFSLKGLSSYAWQEKEGFSLSRRISYLPDWNVSYIFTRTRENYRQNNPGDRPLDLVDKEDIHAIRTEMLHWYNEYVALRYFASAGYDIFRPSPLLSTGGGLRIRLGERLDLDIGAEYNNDTGQAGGGESKALTTSFIYHF